MKFLILFLTFSCFADDKIGRLNKVTNEVTDIIVDTPKNRTTWDKIKGDKEVILIKDSPVLNELKPFILKDNIVQIDTVKIAEQEAKIAEEKAIQEKLIEIAKTEIAKTEIAKEPK
jgi:hypothetical protein